MKIASKNNTLVLIMDFCKKHQAEQKPISCRLKAEKKMLANVRGNKTEFCRSTFHRSSDALVAFCDA